MIPQIIGIKKSASTRRVIRYCSDRGIGYQLVDLKERTPGKRELDAIAAAAGGYDRLIDTESAAYRKTNMGYMDFDPEEELIENTELMRIPVVRTDNGIAINPSDAELESLFGK